MIKNRKIILEFSNDEIGNLGNALGEVCYGFKVLDFEKRMGVTKEEAIAMLKSLELIFRQAERQRLFED